MGVLSTRATKVATLAAIRFLWWSKFELPPVDVLARLSELDLMCTPDSGRKTVAEIRQYLENNGACFAEHKRRLVDEEKVELIRKIKAIQAIANE
jgi:hypothetical protein